MELQYVPAYPNTLDHHHLVAQNVRLVRSVRWTRLASDRNVSMPALVHVLRLRIVELSITLQFVPALQDRLEIHSVIVKLFVHHLLHQ